MSGNLLSVSEFGELPNGTKPILGDIGDGFIREHLDTTEVICQQGDRVVHIMNDSGRIGCQSKGHCQHSSECSLNALKISAI